MRPLLLPPAQAGQTGAMPATCGANGHLRLKAMLSGLLQQRSWWSPEFNKVYYRVRSNAVMAITKMRFRGGKTHPPEPPSSLLPRDLLEHDAHPVACVCASVLAVTVEAGAFA